MATATTTAVMQATPAASPPAADFTAANLDRLLSRLEHILLDSSPSNTQLRLLRKSQYDRNRVGANLDHARTLLFRLEHSSPSASATALPALARAPKAGPASADRTADIHRKRTQLRRLQAALDELHTLPAHEPNDPPNIAHLLGGDPHEDLAARYAAPAPTKQPTAAPPPDGPVATTPGAPASQPTATLRPRKPNAPAPSSAAPHASGNAFARENKTSSVATTPFAPKAKDAPGAPDRTTAQLLEAHEGEQDVLTEGLVTLATALRESTAAFGASLEGASPLVDAAAAALERNVGGLEAAGRRMGALRRVAEGRGWLARMGLYGWIGALWVALVLLVFVLPKLRLR